jgi:hypothetical protein
MIILQNLKNQKISKSQFPKNHKIEKQKFQKVNFRKIKNLKKQKIVNASKMNRPLFENCAGLAGVFGDCCSDVFPDFYFSKFEGLFLSQNRQNMI